MTHLVECDGLHAGYAGHAVVRDFSMIVEPGSITALLGPNGAGKSTILATIAGLLRPVAGRVLFDGHPIRSGRPHHVVRAGLVLVPDDRSLFPRLSVLDHLRLATRSGATTIDNVLEHFPALRARSVVPAGNLSGGEQQMLALARAIAQQPRVMLIDEMSMGLAPAIVESLVPALEQFVTGGDAAVVLVEQHVRLAVELADTAIVLVHGDTVFHGPAREVVEGTVLEGAYLGL